MRLDYVTGDLQRAKQIASSNEAQFGLRVHRSSPSVFLDHRSSPSVRRDHLSSPAFPPPLPPPRRGLALRWRLGGSQPPPPPALAGGWTRRSTACPCRSWRTSSFDASRRCMKLQKPPRLHSPFSFWRQHASRKSVTGESSAYKGRPKEARMSGKAQRGLASTRTSIPPVIEVVDGVLGLGLPLISCIYVPDEVVADVITNLPCGSERGRGRAGSTPHMKLQQVAKLRQLAVQVLVHGVEALLELRLGELADGVVRRVVVHVREQDGLRERRLDVLSGTPVSVSACTNLKIPQSVAAYQRTRAH
jgi:hypothetical protein